MNDEVMTGTALVGTAALARLGFFPIADAYVPKPLQKLAVFGACVAVDVGLAVATGQPVAHALTASLGGACLAMAAFDVQHKRGAK